MKTNSFLKVLIFQIMILSGTTVYASSAAEEGLVVTHLRTNYFNDFFSRGHLESSERANEVIAVISQLYLQLGCRPVDLRVPGQHQGTIVMIGGICRGEVLRLLKSGRQTLNRRYEASRLMAQVDVWTFREKYRINEGFEIGFAKNDRNRIVVKLDNGETDGPNFTLEVLRQLLTMDGKNF